MLHICIYLKISATRKFLLYYIQYQLHNQQHFTLNNPFILLKSKRTMQFKTFIVLALVASIDLVASLPAGGRKGKGKASPSRFDVEAQITHPKGTVQKC